MPTSRIAALLAVLLGVAVLAAGCGGDDGGGDSGGGSAAAECRNAAENLPDGQVRDQALAACDAVEGQGVDVDEVTDRAYDECVKGIEGIPDALRDQARAACDQLK